MTTNEAIRIQSTPHGDQIINEAIAIRHYLHRFPERSYQEHDTTAFLTTQLRKYGIDIVKTGLSTGVVAEIHGTAKDPENEETSLNNDKRSPSNAATTKTEPNILLRADIDGLPVEEDSSFPEPSEHKGVMHACGHDIHMASLLGAARFLQDHRNLIHGKSMILFQPAEEYSGANKVIDEHIIDNADALVGFHNDPRTAPGTVGISKNPIMADAGIFTVTLHGHGCHAADPHKGRSPIEAAAHIVGALQTILSRNIPPLDSAVVSVTQIHAGDVYNIIPSTAMIEGTIREFKPEVLAIIKERFESLVTNIARAYGLNATIDRWYFPGAAVVSDPNLVDAVINHVPQYATLIEPVPTFGGEDFSYYLRFKPGLFALLGSNGAPDAESLHSPRFLAQDETIPVGINYFINSAIDLSQTFAKRTK